MIETKDEKFKHKVIHVPGLFHCAIGNNGCGHWKLLGVTYCWHTLNAVRFGWHETRYVRLFGLVTIIHQHTRGGTLSATRPGWQVIWSHGIESSLIRNGWLKP